MTNVRFISTAALLLGALACSSASSRASKEVASGGAGATTNTGGSGATTEPGGTGTETVGTEPEPVPVAATCEAFLNLDNNGELAFDMKGYLTQTDGVTGSPFGGIGLPPAPDQPCSNLDTLIANGAQTMASFCAAGTIPAHPGSLNSAYLGTTVTTVAGANGPLQAVNEITVHYSATVGSVVRLQVGTADGNFYCAPIPVGVDLTTAIKASTFNTACWDNSGTFWDGLNANAVALSVPSRPGMPTDFDLCLQNYKFL